MSYREAWQGLHGWTEDAIETGWLPAETLSRVSALEQPAADSLFNQQTHRPLLVAFFGGTGAGKSSLLNRLAGDRIAKTGIQRPTSHEVSLYLHKDFQLNLLPPDLPLESTRIRYHQESGRRLLAWIDMPDMDSTAAENRQLVETWLPYIDWLIYVVTPERYHDDRGWRFLQQRRQRHAWLFVMNHWDQGQPSQLEDFQRRLAEEGFTHPRILRTSCLPGFEDDDFAQLEQDIQQGVEDHGLALLQQLGQQARWDDLHQLGQALTHRMGKPKQWETAHQRWQECLDKGLDSLCSTLTQEAGVQQQLISTKGIPLAELPNHFPSLLDNLITARFHSQISGLHLRLGQSPGAQLPHVPLSKALASQEEESLSLVRHHLQQELEAAYARPGRPWQRWLRAVNRELGWLLPLAAATWVVQHVVRGYIRGTTEGAAFLGIDFAIHSALLIGLAWLMPFFLGRKLKPTSGAILFQGLRQGISSAMASLKKHYDNRWQAFCNARDEKIKNIIEQQVRYKQQNHGEDIQALSGSLMADTHEAVTRPRIDHSQAEK
jgi:hypothetical protein